MKEGQYVVEYLDCCETPTLENVVILYESSHNDEILRQCKRCGNYWFFRFYEYISFDRGEDYITVWYSAVTEEEAQRIKQTEGRPDLTFLKRRRTFVKDDQGVRLTIGQPIEPSGW
jgi:hypothetical protein